MSRYNVRDHRGRFVRIVYDMYKRHNQVVFVAVCMTVPAIAYLVNEVVK